MRKMRVSPSGEPVLLTRVYRFIDGTHDVPLPDVEGQHVVCIAEGGGTALFNLPADPPEGTKVTCKEGVGGTGVNILAAAAYIDGAGPNPGGSSGGSWFSNTLVYTVLKDGTKRWVKIATT